MSAAGPVEGSAAAEEFDALAGPAGLPAAEIEEGDAAAEIVVPGVARQDRPGRGG